MVNDARLSAKHFITLSGEYQAQLYSFQAIY